MVIFGASSRTNRGTYMCVCVHIYINIQYIVESAPVFGEPCGLYSEVMHLLFNEDISSRQGRGWLRTAPPPLHIPRGAMGKTQREMIPAGLPCGRCQLCAPLVERRVRKKIQNWIKLRERAKEDIKKNYYELEIATFWAVPECVVTVPFVIFLLLFFFFFFLPERS